MNKTLFLALSAVLSLSSQAIDPSELVGEYLGKPKCAVRVELETDSLLKFTILKNNEEDVEDFLPFYEAKTITVGGDFSFREEGFSRTGEVDRIVSGSLIYNKLHSLTLKTVRSLFSFDQTRCKDLVPVMSSMPN